MLFFISTTSGNSQEKNSLRQAEQILELALKNKPEQRKTKFRLIPKEKTAISYAEIILFELYSKKRIESQKPYQVKMVKDYWIITGTLPKGMKGGVFNLVIDSWNGKIILCKHGK